MIDCVLTKEAGVVWLTITGRIDSMTSAEIDQNLRNCILDSQRIVVVDLAGVAYISSAGLRVFISAQKELNKVDGEVIIYHMTDQVRNVFRMSGFDKLFFVADTRQDIDTKLKPNTASTPVASEQIDGISVQYQRRSGEPGSFQIFGAQDNLAPSAYTQQDVVPVDAATVQFGTGLAALGDAFDAYKDYFGEALILDGNFFYYPAVKRPAVDFMLNTGGESDFVYRFFHGFGFAGAYHTVLSFDRADSFISLNDLPDVLFHRSDADLLGVVLMFESKGFWGMNLKKVPTRENKPENGRDIFDSENFTDWMNFPVEPTDINNTIVSAGIMVRDRNRISRDIRNLLSGENRFHLHAGVFDKAPLNRNPESFEHELTRIITESNVHRIQHVLGQTRFSSGMAGIVELK